MADDVQEVRRINWSECCGFTQLFRSFRLAIHPTKIILAFIAVLNLYLAGRILDFVWPSSSKPVVVSISGVQVSEADQYVQLGAEDAAKWSETMAKQEGARRAGVFEIMLHKLAHADAGEWGLGCCGGVLALGAWMWSMHWVYALLFKLIALANLAFFGGAVCRVAAVHVTRDEKIGLRDALTFARAKYASFFFAPLFPVAILAVIFIVLAAGGLFGWIAGAGDILVPALFFLPLIGGFLAAFVVIGGYAGAWLMFPTIAVEGSDAFDALSRAFNYIYARPWKTAWYVLVSSVYGGLCFLFVSVFVRIMLIVTHLSVGATMNWGEAVAQRGEETVRDVPDKLNAMWQAPSILPGTPLWGSFDQYDLAGSSAFGQFLLMGWIFVVVGLVAAFVLSFAYSATTIIYALLRREVDATDLEELYLEGEDPLAESRPENQPPDEPEKPSGGTSLPIAGQPG